MKRHHIIIIAFVAAVVCYALGFQGAALSLVVAGMIFEAVCSGFIYWFDAGRADAQRFNRFFRCARPDNLRRLWASSHIAAGDSWRPPILKGDKRKNIEP